MLKHFIQVFIVIALFGFSLNDEIFYHKNDNSCIDRIKHNDDRLLIFATLDGTLTAIEQLTGRIIWKIKEDTIVKVPVNITNTIMPIFLPNPRDGSLYLVGNPTDPLKKLPFTIPQLVSSSPCRSSDGILYTGKKQDIWYKLDPKTGNKNHILGFDDIHPTCPIDTPESIYIGKTKYKLMMVNTKNPGNRWNITYYDYSATPMSKEDLSNYVWVHFTSTSSGRLVTLDRQRGGLIWDIDLGSPIIGAYSLDEEGLIAVPFTSLANHTLTYLVDELLMHKGLLQNPNHMKFYPTLYIGEHIHGLYALPSLVDQNVVTITTSENGPLLLGGPYAPDKPKLYNVYPLPGHNYKIPKDFHKDDSFNFQNLPKFEDHFVVFTGHYIVPQCSNQKIIGGSREVKMLTDESSLMGESKKQKSVEVQTDFEKVKVAKEVDDEYEKTLNNYERTYFTVKRWINQQEHKGLKLSLIILTGCVITMFWYLLNQVREMQNMSQNGSQSSKIDSYGTNGHITAISEELPSGLVRVGKITFHPEQLLGKGCEGTFVYRGEFDSRRVAVKRLLPDCFTFADREVALLRESDAHPNVIRYYCTEQDRMFRYIALELCQATLTDYVLKKFDCSLIKPLDILRQATLGLAHLHSLDIVHRDIKPHNVLLSIPNNGGEVRAMISDFGLCKKLQVGKVSFSRRSGVTGTDGWIAPEMLNSNERITYAVDLFSLGCLYYYVLSEGSHPFGDSLRRQSNILLAESDLSGLKSSDWQVFLQKPLLSALISSKPEERPSCRAILRHPMYWSNSKILAFFQDVSDRIEKCESDDPILQSLEKNAEFVVKFDWRMHIHGEVTADLKKYRSYQGGSVRDLMRALRNKRHHFRELSEEAQEHLGQIPDDFTMYWTSRFPLLLAHVWITMQCISSEDIFTNYYEKNSYYSQEKFIKEFRQYYIQNPVNISIDSYNLQDEQLKKCCNFSQVKKSKRNLKISFSENNSPIRRTDRKYLNQSGGLYRNFLSGGNLPDQAKQDQNVFKRNNKGLKNAKKSDEPLVWAVNM